MVSVTYTTLTHLVNDTSIAPATAEEIIDQAINILNTYGCSLSNMTGVAGAKTLTVTSAEAGAVIAVAVEIYSQYYVSSGASSNSYGLGPLSVSQSSSSQGTGSVYAVAKDAADRLHVDSILRT